MELPNVSHCINEAEIHYNPILPSHDFVEIGGIKWATMNIGASSVTDYGLYFQWGDTQGYTAEEVGSAPKKFFYWDDYKYFTVDTTQEGDAYKDGIITKYNSKDGLTTLDASDDAVTAAWGGNWRMPTTAEFQALGNAVTTAWTNDYQGSGIKGLVCTAKDGSGAQLFFPAAAYAGNGSVTNVGSYGYYWSSSLVSGNVSNAYYLYFNSDYVDWGSYGNRCNGYPVRGVLGE